MKKTQADKPLPSARPLRALILDDNRQDVELMVALLKRVGYALSFEVVNSLAHLQQQLARADYHITVSPLFDSSGAVCGSVHVLRDITGRKREVEELRRSEASYRSLIMGAIYGIFRCDVNGKFLAVNPALVAMLKYESEAE
jgi:PAS domain-containing protein